MATPLEFCRGMSPEYSVSETDITLGYGGPWVSWHNQISHGTTKNSHSTTKWLTAQTNTSQHNQIAHGGTEFHGGSNCHGGNDFDEVRLLSRCHSKMAGF